MKEFTILLDICPGFSRSRKYARVLTYSDDERMNFMVGQWNDNLVFKLRNDGPTVIIFFETEGVLKKGKRVSIAIVYEGQNLFLYVEGQLKNAIKTGSIGFSNWDRSYPLAIGSEVDGKFPWQGNIYSIKIYDQAFADEKIMKLDDVNKNTDIEIKQTLDSTKERGVEPLISYSFESSRGSMVIDGGKDKPANLFIPKHFQPYKKNILKAPYDNFEDHWRNRWDIFINILGFIPLGFFLQVYFTGRTCSVRIAFLSAMFIGLGFSLVIELLQAFLPSRSSSMSDLIANSLGTAIGTVFSGKLIFVNKYYPQLPR